VRKFVILAAPRTGSNMLCTLLNSHPSVVCHHELFNPRGIFVALDHRNSHLDLGSVVERDRSPLCFLDRVWATSLGASHIGFKLTRGQGDPVMRHVLHDSSVAKIVLRRSNRLKTFVSQLSAEHSDHWEAYDDGPAMPSSPMVRIEIEALEAHARLNEEFYEDLHRELALGEQPYIDLRYENLHRRREHTRVLSFLGLTPPHPRLAAASVKQGGRDLRAMIANFDELDVALRGSGYHEELHDTWS
jgi:LPS sulfotransferase NodH